MSGGYSELFKGTNGDMLHKRINDKSSRQRYQNAVNNAQGQAFEGYIKAACARYSAAGRAEVDKTPEPFRVMSKQQNGIFTGRFTALAQPDFQGTLAGGQSICFEAKFTTTDRMKRGVLTETQMQTLEQHERLGAVTAVCVGLEDKYYFVPWEIWRDMKERFGRQYVTAADIEMYRVRFNGSVLFLDYVNERVRGK